MKNAHGGMWKERDGYERCSHCGSLTPTEALRRMTTPGCKFSGTDKGAYKFYFTSETGDHGKFYGEHLVELTRDELAAWSAASRRCLGFDFDYVDGKEPTSWSPKSSSFYGWQTWGTVGQDGQPVFDDDAPVPPTDEWWDEAKKKAAGTPAQPAGGGEGTDR